MTLCDCGNAILSAPAKISEENGVEMIGRNVWKVWGSHPEPVKSNTVSPASRHRCDISSDFKAVLAWR